MAEQIVSVTEFKAKCLALLSQVEETGVRITVTRRGRPIATVGPTRKRPWKSLEGKYAGRLTELEKLLELDHSDLWEAVREPDRFQD